MLGLDGGSDLEELRLVVLESVSFVDDETLPLDLSEEVHVVDRRVVRGDERMELRH